MTLRNATPGIEYLISGISTNDSSLDYFLLTLGCFPGESVKIISHLSDSSIVSVKNTRYCFDKKLADAINI